MRLPAQSPRYDTSAPPADWYEWGFDDSGWAEGSGGFGEGDNRGVIRTSWNTSDIWLRTTFELSTPYPSAASLRIYHDDDVEVYLNGVLVFEASGWTSGYLQYALDSSAYTALRVGSNVLAVHCLQRTHTQFVDVGFGSYAWNYD